MTNLNLHLQLWKYREGITTHVGVGHAGVITSVRFSPDKQKIVSASADGAIFIWRCPVIDDSMPTVRSPSTASSRSTCSLREAAMSSKRNSKRDENITVISPVQSVRVETAGDATAAPSPPTGHKSPPGCAKTPPASKSPLGDHASPPLSSKTPPLSKSSSAASLPQQLENGFGNNTNNKINSYRSYNNI